MLTFVLCLELISDELKAENREKLAKMLLKPLKDRVYGVLDEHQKCLHTVLWYHKAVEPIKAFAEAENLYEDLKMDEEYILEMHRKEDDPARKEQPHIVSVSGLALNVFLRLENEHATALKHWTRHQI